MMCLLVVPQMQAHDIRISKSFRRFLITDAYGCGLFCGQMRAPSADHKASSERFPRHGPGNRPEPDEEQLLAAQPVQRLRHHGGAPFPGPDFFLETRRRLEALIDGRQHIVRDILRAIARDITDGDAARLCLPHIDIVVAGSVVREDLAARQLLHLPRPDLNINLRQHSVRSRAVLRKICLVRLRPGKNQFIAARAKRPAEHRLFAFIVCPLIIDDPEKWFRHRHASIAMAVSSPRISS